MSSKKINNKFLESIILEFKDSFGLANFDEQKAFEYLVNYTIISKHHPEAFESLEQLTMVDVDTGSNYGIDAVGIIVNGNLLLNKEDLDLYSRSKKLEVTIVFIQTKTSDSYDTGDLSKFGSAVQNFFSEKPAIPTSEELARVKDIYNELLKPATIRMMDRTKFPKVELHYATTSRSEPNTTLQSVAGQWKSNLKLNYPDLADVDFKLSGAEYIIDTYDDLTNKYTVRIKFERRIDLDTIKGVEGSYIGYLDFANFITLVTDKNTELRKNIFYENVRDFQGEDNKVNAEINETLSNTNYIDKFILLNNGITIVAKQLTPLQNNEYELGEFQIVNGCQTSNMLYLNRQSLSYNKSLYIPIKLIHTTNNEIISKIVKATNRQTPVPDEAFVALDRFHQDLQRFYEIESKELKEKIYYERRSREFQNSDRRIEKYRIVNIHKQIRSFTAIMLNEPHTVISNHPYSIIRSKKESIFAPDHKYEPYFISSYILYFINTDMVTGIILGNQIHFVYHIGMLMRFLITKKIKNNHFNGKEIEQDCKKIIDEIIDVEKRKKMYPIIFGILNRVKRNHKTNILNCSDKELVRLRSFRDEILKEMINSK